MTPYPHKKGFTLLEMTSVLAIVGLLAGAVLAGRSLVHESQVASVMIDTQRYISATKAFQQKYQALPGDFSTATNFWGAIGGSAGTNYTTDCYSSGSATSIATCNGNGDGQIGSSGTYLNEMFRYWQHLADAQLIQGTYTGAAGSAGSSGHVPGTNCPLSRIKGAGFGINYTGIINAADTNFFSGTYLHSYYFGTTSSGNSATQINNLPVNPALTEAEALDIDTKFDDGYPATGNIRAWQPSTGYAPNCDLSSGGKFVYNVNLSGTNLTAYQKLCSLIMITGF